MFLKLKNMVINMDKVEYIYMATGGGRKPEYSVTLVFSSGNSLPVGTFSTKKEAEGFVDALIKQSDIKPKTVKEK